MAVFRIESDHFSLDGAPFRVLAGAMHYFRVVPEYWRDRLLKLRAMGLNTLETYVAWNLHEPQPGTFDFAGWRDLDAYLRLASELGLYILLRPGPYICAEWDLGGLPAWLLRDPGMRLRCAHPPYLEAVDRYLDALVPQFAHHQVTRGGRLLAVQVENEYGSYGNDQVYLQHLADGLRRRGVEVPLFTADGPTDEMLQYGGLNGVLRTVNFGSDARQGFAKLREYQPAGPLVCMEFWNGWVDHWGEPHHRRAAQDAAAAVDELLGAGGSLSLYMFHGGTNFGLMNGANCQQGQYQPTVTSYDDDAPLDEAGQPTPKFHALRDAIGRHVPLPPLSLPAPVPRCAPGAVQLPAAAPLLAQLEALSGVVARATPEPMEALGQDYGFILYSTRVTGPRSTAPLRLRDLHDRALVFVDGALLGVLEREFPERTLELVVPAAGVRLDILVENLGRVNYGPDLLDRKGITEGVLLGQQYLYGWRIRCLPLRDLSRLQFRPGPPPAGPAFYRGRFVLQDAVGDTFLALPGWHHGVAWINGFNLGRYWDRGPQRTLYVPAPRLRRGENELVVFELHPPAAATVVLGDCPDLG